MKLSSDEARAVAFVLGLVGLATAARIVTRPHAAEVPPAAALDAAGLEDSSEKALSISRSRTQPLGSDERIDVNGEDAAQLDRLPGVGPGLAARIVEERERGGAFDSAPDLRAVRGIGAALLARLEPHLAFGLAPALPRRSPVVASGAARVEAGSREDKAPTAAEPLDLNMATAAQLDALPGVGPALAARIVAKRDSLNGFGKVDDLREVRGIGPATLERLRPFLRSRR